MCVLCVCVLTVAATALAVTMLIFGHDLCYDYMKAKNKDKKIQRDRCGIKPPDTSTNS